MMRTTMRICRLARVCPEESILASAVGDGIPLHLATKDRVESRGRCFHLTMTSARRGKRKENNAPPWGAFPALMVPA
jgi:hypothetical protein